MKQIISFLLTAAAIAVAGCSSGDKTPVGPYSHGSVDATVYVAIGNSLTSGYRDGALFEEGQRTSFPALFARQLGTNFVQPLMPAPGTGTRITLASLTPVTLVSGSTTITPPANATYTAPYNNLGIPAAVIFDALDNSDIVQKSATRKNPFFQLIMRDQQVFGKSLVEQALKLNPTLITLWLGANDVLGFAASGGVSPEAPTPKSAFDAMYGNTLKALRQGAPNATILVATIPDPKVTPFFVTAGPQIAASLKKFGLTMVYQKHGEPGVASGTTQLNLPIDCMIPLTAIPYAPLIGLPTGKWYRDLAQQAGVPVAAVIPGSVDTTKPFGLHPQNPWPDALVLDLQEQQTAVDFVQAYNASIRSIAATNNALVVDMHAVLNDVAMNGYSAAGETLTSAYISGGIFGLDGIHPTAKGSALIANAFLETLKQKGANVPYVDLTTLPGISVPLGKRGVGPITSWQVAPAVFNNVVKLFQVRG